MKNSIKEWFSELWGAVGVAVICIVVIAIVAGSLFAAQAYLYPSWLSVQRNAVKQSKSFTDANNNMLETYKLEYGRLDTKIAEAQADEILVSAYRAQQNAIIEKMCREISTMKRETVNPSTLSWLNSQGGCQ